MLQLHRDFYQWRDHEHEYDKNGTGTEYGSTTRNRGVDNDGGY